jgi:hypothetical protein
MYEEMLNLIHKEYRPDEEDKYSEEDKTLDTPKDSSNFFEGEDSDDEEDEELDRNPDASPLIMDKKGAKIEAKKKRGGWADKQNYAPRLTDIAEETEPESSFKNTKRDKFGRIIRENSIN